MKVLANYYLPKVQYNNVNFGMIRIDSDDEASKGGSHPLSGSTTLLFREPHIQSAVVKLLKKDKPTTLKVLGCSDGSEAWSYAVLLSKAFKDKNLVKVEAVDKKESLIELAKTGYLLCSDIEKQKAGEGEIALKGKNWSKYFEQQSEEPSEFQALASKHRGLSDIATSKNGGVTPDNGAQWYKINQENLCDVEFINDDMRNQIKTDAEQTVYVMASSVCYIGESEGTDKIVEVFEKIQNENYNKKTPTYIALGAVEIDWIDNHEPCVWKYIERLGFEHIPQYELMQAGVKNNESMEDVKRKVFRLKPSAMPKKANFRCQPGFGCPPYVVQAMLRGEIPSA